MVGKLRLYLNTDVLLSLLEGQEAGSAKLGENVARLLHQAADGKYQVLVSEHTARELLAVGVPREYLDQVLRPMLLFGGNDLLLVNEDIVRGALKAYRQYEMPFFVALHMVFTQRNNALLVTRDKTIALAAREKCGVMAPEDLLA
jgi:hypothetical protein